MNIPDGFEFIRNYDAIEDFVYLRLNKKGTEKFTTDKYYNHWRRAPYKKFEESFIIESVKALA